MSIWDFIFMLLGLDLVLHNVEYLCILYVTLFRLIVLYSRCRVNQDTNMSVVCVLCNFVIASTVRLGSICGVPNLWDASPLSYSPLHTSCSFPCLLDFFCEDSHCYMGDSDGVKHGPI